jgi:hypothetical protein
LFISFNFKLKDILNVILIPIKAYCLLVLIKFIIALKDLLKGCFIKRPRLNAYILFKLIKIGDKVLKEVIVLETLKTHLYLNIIKYISY